MAQVKIKLRESDWKKLEAAMTYIQHLAGEDFYGLLSERVGLLPGDAKEAWLRVLCCARGPKKGKSSVRNDA